MRPTTQAQRDLLRSAGLTYHLLAWAEDEGGGWQDLTTLGGVDWVTSAEWETNVDQPVWTATLRLLRETHPTNSLAPLMGVSLRNRLGGVLSKALWVGRRLRLFVAVRPPDYTPNQPPPPNGGDPPPATPRAARVHQATLNVTGATPTQPLTGNRARTHWAEAEAGVAGGASAQTTTGNRARLHWAEAEAAAAAAPAGNRARIHWAVAEAAPTAVVTDPHPGGDWIEVFNGIVQEVEWAREDEIALHAHDRGARLLAHTMVNDVVLDNMTLEAGLSYLMQTNGVHDVPLYTPTSPNRMITNVRVQRKSLLNAMRDLAHEIGWEVRYKYDTNGVFRLTLYRPSPPNSVPVQQFGPSDYRDISRLNVSLAPVRTVVRINYNDINSRSDEHVLSPSLSDVVMPAPGTPIAQYGARLYERTFDAGSNIRMRVEAQTLADIIRADIEEVYADKEVEMWLWWPAEPSDYYGFDGNNVHYDSIQNHGVVAIRHRMERGEAWTNLQTRGKPVVFYRTWLREEDGPYDPPAPPSLVLRMQEWDLPDGKFLHAQVELSRSAAQWKLWLRKGAWPTVHGTQGSSLDDTYLKVFGTRDNVQARFSVQAYEDWYAAAMPFDEEGNAGEIAYYTHTTQTGTPPGGDVGVLFNLAHFFEHVHDGWGYIVLTWNHNNAIQSAGAGEYDITIAEGWGDPTPHTTRNAVNERGGDDSIVNYGEWRDTFNWVRENPPPSTGPIVRLPDGGDSTGTWRELTYRVNLRRNGTVIQTLHYSVRMWVDSGY
jgi:hypothetical protein